MSHTASSSRSAGSCSGPHNTAPYSPVSGTSAMVQVGLGNDEDVKCFGYCSSIVKWIFVGFLTIVTLGLVLLVFYWKPEWGLWCTNARCSLRHAEVVLLQDEYGQYFVEKIHVRPIDEGLIQQIYPARNGPDTNVGENASVMKFSINRRQSEAAQSNSSYVTTMGAELCKEAEGEEEDYDSDTSITKALIVPEKKRETRRKLHYFEFQKLTYFWNQDYQFFQLLHGLDVGVTNAAFYTNFNGLTVSQQSKRCSLFGQNLIDVKVQPYHVLFVQEILNPFYVFEIFSIALWFAEQYNSYAICIVIILIITLGISLYETKKQSITLRNMVAHHSTVTVCRLNGTCEEIDSRWLVPGDVILVPKNGCVMSCDAVLISGNCIVNESMLTGESVPVTKTPLPNPPFSEAEGMLYYSAENHKRHTLFCGTHVIQTRFYGSGKVKAVVTRTGFLTLKGDLIRTILYPKPVGFKFYRDALKFVGILSLIGLLGMIYSIVVLMYRKADTMDSVWKVLDIITICVPPALPAAMTVGTVYAQNRLKKNGIFCISPQRINVCGKVKLVCFDKTGTLTEDGLDLWGVVPLQAQHFLPAEQNVADLSPGPFLVAMATCHSLTMINGELVGDPLDLKMFDGTNWVLEEPGSDTTRFDTIIPTIVRPRTSDSYLAENPDRVPYEVGILRQFPFSSGLQRMSVITRTLGAKNMEVFVKGSPEMIASLSLKETVPTDFPEVLQRFTQQGYRVIALAWRPLDPKLAWHHSQRIARKDVECGLNFLGLLVLQNALKPETTPVIHELTKANIRTVMVTGDNMLTAISVARDCGMVAPRAKVIMVYASPLSGDTPAAIEWSYDTTPEKGLEKNNKSSTTELYNGNGATVSDAGFHLAVTGKSFAILREHFPELIPKIVQRGTVFARMAPDQKTQLVEALQDISYCVAMCGDGANDCGALKTAHAGISLSEAEASVASPFTSKTPNISAVPVVVREGRASLVTSLCIFKYMALYSIIQFASVVILYWTNSNLGDWQFLYVDLIITTSVATLMGLNGPHPILVRRRPPGSLLSPSFLLSILVEVILVCSLQAVAYFSLGYTSWYHPPQIHPSAEANICGYENTVVFTVSSFQYMILAGAFSKGAPYRTPIYKNVIFILDLTVLTILSTLMLFLPAAPGGPLHWFLIEVMQLKLMSKAHLSYVFFLFGLVLFNFLVSFLLETFVVDSELLRSCIAHIRCKRRPKNIFKTIEKELRADPSWPPVGQTTYPEPPMLQAEIS